MYEDCDTCQNIFSDESYSHVERVALWVEHIEEGSGTETVWVPDDDANPDGSGSVYLKSELAASFMANPEVVEARERLAKKRVAGYSKNPEDYKPWGRLGNISWDDRIVTTEKNGLDGEYYTTSLTELRDFDTSLFFGEAELYDPSTALPCFVEGEGGKYYRAELEEVTIYSTEEANRVKITLTPVTELPEKYKLLPGTAFFGGQKKEEIKPVNLQHYKVCMDDYKEYMDTYKAIYDKVNEMVEELLNPPMSASELLREKYNQELREHYMTWTTNPYGPDLSEFKQSLKPEDFEGGISISTAGPSFPTEPTKKKRKKRQKPTKNKKGKK